MIPKHREKKVNMGTIADNLQIIAQCKEDIKDAIESKGVSVGDIPFTNYADKIGEIGDVSIQEADDNDVIFYDYDGFKVASYTIAEAKALTTLPTPPSHPGLTFQGWNWTLNDIQTYNRRFIDVGAIYIPTDGKTRIKIRVLDTSTDLFTLSINVPAGMNLKIDYGDGYSENKDRSGSNSGSNYTLKYTYSQAGNYNVVFTIVSNTQNSSYSFLNNNTANYTGHIIKETNIGNNVILGNYALQHFWGKLTIPSNIDTLGTSCFTATNIVQITIPRQNITFPKYCFYRIGGNISFPKTCTSFMPVSSSSTVVLHCCKRLIIPEPSTTTLISSEVVANGPKLEVYSIPSNSTLNNGNITSGCPLIRCIDIVQGYVPNMSLTLNGTTIFSPVYLVEFFNKLGTTNSAITITLGNTNLNRLTADQKAIATNKGYTLA